MRACTLARLLANFLRLLLLLLVVDASAAFENCKIREGNRCKILARPLLLRLPSPLLLAVAAAAGSSTSVSASLLLLFVQLLPFVAAFLFELSLVLSDFFFSFYLSLLLLLLLGAKPFVGHAATLLLRIPLPLLLAVAPRVVSS